MQPFPKAWRSARSVRSALLATAALALALGLWGCATHHAAHTADADDDATSGATAYGQLNMSVDSVTVRNARDH